MLSRKVENENQMANARYNHNINILFNESEYLKQWRYCPSKREQTHLFSAALSGKRVSASDSSNHNFNKITFYMSFGVEHKKEIEIKRYLCMFFDTNKNHQLFYEISIITIFESPLYEATWCISIEFCRSNWVKVHFIDWLFVAENIANFSTNSYYYRPIYFTALYSLQ